ncbi:MAG: 4-oxalocrotonate tautomerase DmpI [Candidatus Hydrothermarchaeota archaeon]
MPNIIVEGPPLDVESKRKLVEEFTEVAAKVYKMQKEVFLVLIKENPPENVGIGGKLIIDRE